VTKIAIIGAGLSGLVTAHRLKDHFEVEVFEKSVAPGGRIATRYADPFRFDHGAQFFTARSNSFKEFLIPLIDQKAIARWDARFVEYEKNQIVSRRDWDDEYPHYVGVPGMNIIGRELAKDISIHYQTHIEQITFDGQWQLTDQHHSKRYFDWVILTLPPAQAQALIGPDINFHHQVSTAKMQGCYSLMIGAEEIDLGWDAALVKSADISWISVNSSKPGRDAYFSLLVHSTNRWADQNIDMPIEQVTDYLLDEVKMVIAQPMNIKHAQVHRWKYANCPKQAGERSLIDNKNQIAACGDWCIRGRIESAFLSAEDVSSKILESLKAV